MNSMMSKLIFHIIVVSNIIHFSCDERTPDDSGTAETGSLSLATRFIVGSTSNPVIVGEILSNPQTSAVVIARLLDGDGEGVNGKPLIFSVSGVSGSFDTNDPTTKYIPNFKEYGFEDLGGNGYAMARFTPNLNQKKIETASSSGAIITVKYTDDIIDNVEFSVYDKTDLIWPYTIKISADDQVDLGGTTNFEVLLENAYGDELSGVKLLLESEHGSLQCADTCFTDATGKISTVFEAYSFDENVGPGTVSVKYYHPEIQDSVDVSQQIIIGSESAVGNCTYIEIPASSPSRIVVRDGGGIESTDITAKVYDDNGNLITTPIIVNFTIEPVLNESYLNSPGQNTVDVETVNGVATASINSGTEPGPIRIIATTNTNETTVCDSSNDALESIAVPVIVASGAPYHIEAEYDPQATEAIGGGFYRTECAAIISDIWYNPVEDSTYIYWGIDPIPPDTIIDAFVEGVSFTNNNNLNDESFSGVAFSQITYSTDAIGDIGRVKALTFGTNGDTVSALINEGEGDATLFFLPGQITLMSSFQYWDFTLPQASTTAVAEITAIVIDFYGNPVADAPIAFGGTGVSLWSEVGYENEWIDLNGNSTLDPGEGWIDEGVNGAGEGDGCFTWRDYGIDDDPQTVDWGTWNDDHDAIDTTNDGKWDAREVSEFFNDWGLDGTRDTFDEGEGDGEWNGYHMIGCEAVVKTDKDGQARILATFPRELCIWQSTDDESGVCTFEDFTSTISATLMIPQITTSDPLDIQLVRSPTTIGCP